MPRDEVKVRSSFAGRRGPEVVMEILLTPRGSGNRKMARQLAQCFKSHPKLGPHVRRCCIGSSKVIVHMIPSRGLMKVMLEWNRERAENPDVPGQLPLFGGPVLA